jgi:hypothetical protein
VTDDMFTATRDELELIAAIARRASDINPSLSTASVAMALEACHCAGCRLDLKRMLNASDGQLMHDVLGVMTHLDRDTGRLGGCFRPRFAA